MGKTYNHIQSGRQTRKLQDNYEYLPEFTNYFGNKPATYYDESRTTDSANKGLSLKDKHRRHPYKYHRSSLSRELTQTESFRTKNWRNPYGRVEDRSSRLRTFKHLGNKQRRTRIKVNTRNQIENELMQ